MKKIVVIIFLACFVVTLLYVAGLVFFLTDHEPGDKCEMTYMFEYPQYVRVFQSIDDKYPKYGLYAYGEGRMTKNARNMQFQGIPVLFIPGNAGSHQQVRSLSSIALRKALNSGTSFHFDYFTVDLNSEFSALYGPVLYDQLTYVLNSINCILELYKYSSVPPKQVVLISHSVGGVVARKAVSALLRRNKHLVSVIITLASPLVRLPIYFDRYASRFYANSSYQQDDITSISIAGGYSDILVPSYLTVMEENNASINLVATNIAKAWVESNHVQILWCKQIVLAINRALFDSVDQKTRQISDDSHFVRQVFKHHLIHNSGSQRHLTENLNQLVKIDYRGQWIESLYRQYSVELKNGIKQPHWYMVGITTQPTYEMLTILAINLEVTDWVFVCNAAYQNKASRVCVEAEHLTDYSEIAPTSRHKRRLLTVNMHEIRKRNKEYSHVVFRVLPTSEPVTLHVDTYGSYEREIQVILPTLSLTKHVITQETPNKALIYNLIFPGLKHFMQIYQLFVEPIKCSVEQHHATASLIVPWASESVHTHFTELSNKPFILRLQHSKPSDASENARVRLILEPSCTYKISVRIHILGVFGQIARYYSTFLISTLAVVFLLGFQNQIYVMGETQKVPIFFSSLIHGLKQSWCIFMAYLVSVAFKNYISEPEFQISSSFLQTAIVMTVLLMVSYIVVWILVAAYCLSLFTLESTVHKLTLKLLARSVTVTIRFSDYFMTFLQKVPFLVAVALIVLCCSTCGGLALCVGLIFYFLKLTQMSQDYVEQVGWFILKNVARKIKEASCNSKKQTQSTSTNEEVLAVEGSGANQANNEESLKTIDADSTDESMSNTKEELNSQNNEEACENSIESLDNEPIGDIRNINETDRDAVQSVEEDGDRAEETKRVDSPETNKIDSLKDMTETNNAIFFHSSIFFIWVFVTVLNIPAVLTWAHNFKYSRNLSPDESLFPGLVFSIGSFFLWQFDLPRVNRKFSFLLRYITLGLIPIIFLYSPVSVYRLNYGLTFLFALVLLQQSFAPKIENSSDASSPQDSCSKKEEDKYKETKMKID